MSTRDYEQHEEEIVVPKGAGVAGLLEAMKGVLNLPRVTNIVIQSPAKISYTFFLRKGDKKTQPQVSFDDLMPYAIVRNGEVEEIPYPSADAPSACAELFEHASRDHMAPVCFLGGENSAFWEWYKYSLGRDSPTREELFGLPFLTDRDMENMSLLLCTAYRRGGSIVDTIKSYKVSIPAVPT